MNRVKKQKLESFLTRILQKKKVNHEVAKLTVNGLIHASLRGVDSHGVRLFFHYLNGLNNGRINPNPKFKFEQTSPSTGILDADHTFGHAAGIKAMDHSISLANKSGSGHVAVKNSSHCGSLSYFALEACKNDMIGVAYTNATSRLKSANSTREFFGNNPMCFTAPLMDEDPFCYDGANSLTTFNEVRRHRDLGLKLPHGVVADKKGNITTDPNEANQLIPIGDYKGFALSMIVDIFCGLLTGMPTGRDVTQMFGDEKILKQKRFLGQFYSSYSIEKFIPKNLFKERLQNLVNTIIEEPSINKKNPVLVPGDIEKNIFKERLLMGLPIPNEDFKRFKEIETEYLKEDLL